MAVPETLRFEDDGRIPNSALPVLIYRDVEAVRDAGACEALFARHGWRGAWHASGDLVVVGAYPDGMAWDVRRGDPSERDEVLANLRAVPLPASDPVTGAPLWK